MDLKVFIVFTLLFCYLDTTSGKRKKGKNKPPKGQGTTCPLVMPKVPPCIDLKAPEDVAEALETCFNTATDIDFQCSTVREMIMEWVNEKFPKRTHDRSKESREQMKPTENSNSQIDTSDESREVETGTFNPFTFVENESNVENAPTNKTKRAAIKKKKKGQQKTRLSHTNQKMNLDIKMKKLDFMSSFHWFVFFTKDIAPIMPIIIAPDNRTKIRENFRNCFLNKTNLDMDDIVDREALKTIIERYEGDASNKTVLLNSIDNCNNSTTQEEFSKCTFTYLSEACDADRENKSDVNKEIRKSIKNSKGCEPCFNLTSSEELKETVQYCTEEEVTKEFHSKLLECYKKRNTKNPAIQKAMQGPKGKDMWMNLFLPENKQKWKVGKVDREEINNCIYERFNMGTVNDINPKGYTDLIENYILGSVKSRAFLMATVEKCTQNRPVSQTVFRACMLDYMEKECVAAEDKE